MFHEFSFSFAFFDTDKSGQIDMNELKALIEMQIKGAPPFLNKAKILNVASKMDPKGMMSFEAFKVFDEKFPLLLYPVFRIQNALQTECLGIKFWEDRKVLFSETRKEIKEEREQRANAKPDKPLDLKVKCSYLISS
jgi:hypothetical protein